MKTPIYPEVPFNRVLAYKMANTNETVIDEFGQLSRHTVGDPITLSDQQVLELTSLLTDSDNYGGGASRCFEPHIGYVFYNDYFESIAHITICLGCSNLVAVPSIPQHINMDHCLSPIGVEQFRTFEEQILGSPSPEAIEEPEAIYSPIDTPAPLMQQRIINIIVSAQSCANKDYVSLDFPQVQTALEEGYTLKEIKTTPFSQADYILLNFIFEHDSGFGQAKLAATAQAPSVANVDMFSSFADETMEIPDYPSGWDADT
ncbi:MAG: hypothetical protein GY810_18280 [Aureispira sp.]|nr:hypothetical protein [Aureispira sp.]